MGSVTYSMGVSLDGFIVGPDGDKSIRPFPAGPSAHCVFEHVYFSNPASKVFGQTVHTVREQMGRQLAREAPAARFCWQCRKPLHARTDRCPFCNEKQ